ncbi:MAG: TadE/TadG family type IV pilus assembly protein [Actinomycetaceae bacterium]|nr:TadE/TadG family type IV pilus assembly protein [Actinomycetaceae bacterium]
MQSLVVVVILALLQLGFALHTRNMAIDAASEAARRVSLVGATHRDGIERARALLDASVVTDPYRQIHVTEEIRDGFPVVTVEIQTRLPVLGPLGPARALYVKASAWKESV